MYYNKFQQGGQADALLLFVSWLAQVFEILNEEQLLLLALLLGEEGIALMQLIFQLYPDPAQARQVVQQMMGQALSARKGAVLNYYKKVMGICGSNERAVFYQKGGKVCKTCQLKQQGGRLDEEEVLRRAKRQKDLANKNQALLNLLKSIKVFR